MNEESKELRQGDVQDVFGTIGTLQAEAAWFLFCLGQLVIVEQGDSSQSPMLIEAMRADIVSFAARAEACTQAMTNILDSIGSNNNEEEAE